MLSYLKIFFQAKREPYHVVLYTQGGPRSSVRSLVQEEDQDSPDSMSETRPFSPGSSKPEPTSIPPAFLARTRAKKPKKRPICSACSKSLQVAKTLHVSCSNCRASSLSGQIVFCFRESRMVEDMMLLLHFQVNF